MRQYDLCEYFEDLFVLFGDAGLVGGVYALASAFRKEIGDVAGAFPSLLITGLAGTGKTELAKSLMAMYADPDVMIRATCNPIEDIDRDVKEWDRPLVHISDYAARLDFNFHEWGKTANCGILVTSQEEIPAMDEKSVLSILPVNVGQKTHDLSGQSKFQRFSYVRENVRRINPESLSWERDMFVDFFAKALDTATEWLRLSAMPVPSEPNILRIWAILPATFLTLAESLHFIDYSRLLYLCRAGIAYHSFVFEKSLREGGEI